MNNQTNSRKKQLFHQKEEKGDDKNAVAVVRSVSPLGCVSSDWEALVSQSSKQSR